MSQPTPSPIRAPPHILALLSKLHKLSLDQERALAQAGHKWTASVLNDFRDEASPESARAQFDTLMRDKFIALEPEKCQFVYQLISAMQATNVVEAGTSFGVSTIYLSLAVGQVSKATGKKGVVIATEKEAGKAAVAREHWKECGEEVEKYIDLREGDLLETLKVDVPQIDLLLLDSRFDAFSSIGIDAIRGRGLLTGHTVWTPLALPTLKLIQPRMRPGSVVLADNTIMAAEGYKDFLAYMQAPENGFQHARLPFDNGFEMCVYMPQAN